MTMARRMTSHDADRLVRRRSSMAAADDRRLLDVVAIKSVKQFAVFGSSEPMQVSHTKQCNSDFTLTHTCR